MLPRKFFALKMLIFMTPELQIRGNGGPITRVVTSDHHRQPKHESYEEIPFHCRKNNEKKTLDSKDLLLLPQIKT